VSRRRHVRCAIWEDRPHERALVAHDAAALVPDPVRRDELGIILGGGNPWLPPDVRMALELVDEHRLGGVVHLHYRAR
jgi:hypothetical protein